MIDFRYHLVSIVAIFLALAVGLLLGSTVLRPYALKGLQAASRGEQHQISTLLATRDALERQVAGDNQFAQANLAQLVGQRLAGQHVVLVAAPGAPDAVSTGLTQVLGDAGASVTGELQLQPAFFDTSPIGRQRLIQLAQSLAPAGLNLLGSAQSQASELIANSVLTKDGAGEPVAGLRDSITAAVLDGLSGGGFLTTASGQPADRATLAVVIVPATPATTDDANPASQALITLAQQLDLAGLGTVVVGTTGGSGPGSAIDVMRQGGRAGHLSSVDNADSLIGQIIVVQALANRMRGISGSYGTASTANSAAPNPGPAASPTPSPTISPVTSARNSGHRLSAGARLGTR